MFNIYLDDLAKLNNYNNAQSVSELQKLLSACENELELLDMVINIKKSCCLRIGPRCNVSCANISSQDGRLFSWVSELRYLGVFIVRSRIFINSLFGKLLNLASEVVILELVSAKCFPCFYMGLNAVN